MQTSLDGFFEFRGETIHAFHAADDDDTESVHSDSPRPATNQPPASGVAISQQIVEGAAADRRTLPHDTRARQSQASKNVCLPVLLHNLRTQPFGNVQLELAWSRRLLRLMSPMVTLPASASQAAGKAGISALNYDSDGSLLAVGSAGGVVRLYDQSELEGRMVTAKAHRVAPAQRAGTVRPRDTSVLLDHARSSGHLQSTEEVQPLITFSSDTGSAVIFVKWHNQMETITVGRAGSAALAMYNLGSGQDRPSCIVSTPAARPTYADGFTDCCFLCESTSPMMPSTDSFEINGTSCRRITSTSRLLAGDGRGKVRLFDLRAPRKGSASPAVAWTADVQTAYRAVSSEAGRTAAPLPATRGTAIDSETSSKLDWPTGSTNSIAGLHPMRPPPPVPTLAPSKTGVDAARLVSTYTQQERAVSADGRGTTLSSFFQKKESSAKQTATGSTGTAKDLTTMMPGLEQLTPIAIGQAQVARPQDKEAPHAVPLLPWSFLPGVDRSLVAGTNTWQTPLFSVLHDTYHYGYETDGALRPMAALDSMAIRGVWNGGTDDISGTYCPNLVRAFTDSGLCVTWDDRKLTKASFTGEQTPAYLSVWDAHMQLQQMRGPDLASSLGSVHQVLVDYPHTNRVAVLFSNGCMSAHEAASGHCCSVHTPQRLPSEQLLPSGPLRIGVPRGSVSAGGQLGSWLWVPQSRSITCPPQSAQERGLGPRTHFRGTTGALARLQEVQYVRNALLAIDSSMLHASSSQSSSAVLADLQPSQWSDGLKGELTATATLPGTQVFAEARRHTLLVLGTSVGEIRLLDTHEIDPCEAQYE